jgi:hypothetical protein
MRLKLAISARALVGCPFAANNDTLAADQFRRCERRIRALVDGTPATHAVSAAALLDLAVCQALAVAPVVPESAETFRTMVARAAPWIVVAAARGALVADRAETSATTANAGDVFRDLQARVRAFIRHEWRGFGDVPYFATAAVGLAHLIDHVDAHPELASRARDVLRMIDRQLRTAIAAAGNCKPPVVH